MSMPTEGAVDLSRHHIPENLSDRFALIFVKFLRFFTDIFFAKRFGHRAIVLETVAAVPGMVAGALQHLRALRRMEDDQGWIRILLDEAENERMHLMTFIHIAKPSGLERILVLFTQGVFYNFFFVLYLITPKTAHRIVGYFEEEAIVSYFEYLKEIDSGLHENVSAPRIAIEYWDLAPDARLRDVVKVIRDDEAGHRNVNHDFANSFSRGSRAVVG